uniref:Uncharacterized protein n=1 Tax=Sphaerodactylus townsendi TaxID=933632 RepID=A0ACB8EFK3_9SAUR
MKNMSEMIEILGNGFQSTTRAMHELQDEQSSLGDMVCKIRDESGNMPTEIEKIRAAVQVFHAVDHGKCWDEMLVELLPDMSQLNSLFAFCSRYHIYLRISLLFQHIFCAENSPPQLICK